MTRAQIAVAGRAARSLLRGVFVAGVFLHGVAGLPVLAEGLAQPSAREVESAVAAVYPALVNISAVARDFAEGRDWDHATDAGNGCFLER